MTWWPFILLGLAAYRTWHLLAQDSITESFRNLLEDLFTDGVRRFVECCWCLGFWFSIAWWACWEVWPHGTMWVAAPFALSAVVGLVASHDGE